MHPENWVGSVARDVILCIVETHIQRKDHIPSRRGKKFDMSYKNFMKRYILIFVVSAFCFSCEGEVKVDKKKIDEAGDKLQKTVEKGADSLGAKLDRLEDKLDKDDTLK